MIGDVGAFVGTFRAMTSVFSEQTWYWENIPSKSWARLLLKLTSCWRDIGWGQFLFPAFQVSGRKEVFPAGGLPQPSDGKWIQAI